MRFCTSCIALGRADEGTFGGPGVASRQRRRHRGSATSAEGPLASSAAVQRRPAGPRVAIGLVRWSNAPRRIASMVDGRVGVAGEHDHRQARCNAAVAPLREELAGRRSRGMRRSTNARSRRSRSQRPQVPRRPSSASMTRCPASDKRLGQAGDGSRRRRRRSVPVPRHLHFESRAAQRATAGCTPGYRRATGDDLERAIARPRPVPSGRPVAKGSNRWLTACPARRRGRCRRRARTSHRSASAEMSTSTWHRPRACAASALSSRLSNARARAVRHRSSRSCRRGSSALQLGSTAARPARRGTRPHRMHPACQVDVFAHRPLQECSDESAPAANSTRAIDALDRRRAPPSAQTVRRSRAALRRRPPARFSARSRMAAERIADLVRQPRRDAAERGRGGLPARAWWLSRSESASSASMRRGRGVERKHQAVQVALALRVPMRTVVAAGAVAERAAPGRAEVARPLPQPHQQPRAGQRRRRRARSPRPPSPFACSVAACADGDPREGPGDAATCGSAQVGDRRPLRAAPVSNHAAAPPRAHRRRVRARVLDRGHLRPAGMSVLRMPSLVGRVGVGREATVRRSQTPPSTPSASRRERSTTTSISVGLAIVARSARAGRPTTGSLRTGPERHGPRPARSTSAAGPTWSAESSIEEHGHANPRHEDDPQTMVMRRREVNSSRLEAVASSRSPADATRPQSAANEDGDFQQANAHGDDAGLEEASRRSSPCSGGVRSSAPRPTGVPAGWSRASRSSGPPLAPAGRCRSAPRSATTQCRHARAASQTDPATRPRLEGCSSGRRRTATMVPAAHRRGRRRRLGRWRGACVVERLQQHAARRSDARTITNKRAAVTHDGRRHRPGDVLDDRETATRASGSTIASSDDRLERRD